MGNPNAILQDYSKRVGGRGHRQSLSISSLPSLETSKQPARVDCDEKRTSVSAVSSPRVRATEPAEKPMLPQSSTIASFLGQVDSSRRKPTLRNQGRAPQPDHELLVMNHLKLELASESDRKPASFNPFRGHRRVGSGSNVTPPCNKSSWDYSPRAKSSSSANASPKKQSDKYAVSKIAASLFHAPGAKLERSMSLSRGVHRASQVEKKLDHGAGEVILPQVTPSSQPQRASEHCVHGASRVEEPALPSMQNRVIDTTKRPEGEEGAPAVQLPTPPVEQNSSELATLNSPVLETVLQGELIYDQSPPDADSSSPSPSTAERMSHTQMEVPDSPIISIAALFEDKKTDVLHNPPGIGHYNPSVVRHNPLLQTKGDLRLSKNHGGYDSRPSSFPMCHVETKSKGEDYAKVTEEELTEAAIRCSISSEGDDSPASILDIGRNPLLQTKSRPRDCAREEDDSPASILDIGRNPLLQTKSRPRDCAREEDARSCSTFPGEDEDAPAPNKKREFMMIRVSSTPPRMVHEEACFKKISVMKPTLRKRRRTVSASGIGAMLLKVVRVPESGTIVTRRFVESPDVVPMEEHPWRAPKYALEKTAVIESLGHIIHPCAAPVVCETELPEDAVKSTYSKFVDIEIDPGHGCVELVQHSKDIACDSLDDDTGWKRNQQGPSAENSPRHRPPVKINTCRVHEGKTKARKIKTIRRGMMNSYDLDTLKEYLKTTDSLSGFARIDKVLDTPSPSPPSPPPPPPVMDLNRSTQERSRTFVSRLQAPSSGAFSYVDVYRPCSVSILSNPSFSSSHQDKLWEEQAEIYSSGGRGTPGREDEAAPPPPTTLLFNLHHSPSPGFGSVNSHSHSHQQQHHHHTLRRSGLSMRAGSPSESGHFMQQIMSRIRGSSPKSAAHSSCPKSQLEISKRRNPWSSCICFSVKS